MILIEIREQLQKFSCRTEDSDPAGFPGGDLQDVQTLQDKILAFPILIRLSLEDHRSKIRDLLPIWGPKERLHIFFHGCDHDTRVVRLNDMQFPEQGRRHQIRIDNISDVFPIRRPGKGHT